MKANEKVNRQGGTALRKQEWQQELGTTDSVEREVDIEMHCVVRYCMPLIVLVAMWTGADVQIVAS